MKFRIFSLSILFVSLNAFSMESTATSSVIESPAQAEVYRNKARVLIDQKDWNGAAVEIRQATQYNPKDADAWLILGTVAMRLEANTEARDAFNKYLALNPPDDKAAAVRQRLAELEVRLDKQKKIEEDEAKAAAKKKADRFGPRGSGFFVASSPSYKPNISTDDDLNSTMSGAYEFGFRVSLVDVGLRLGSGTVARVTVNNDKNAFLRTETNGKHSMWELFTNINIPVNEPEEGKAGLQFLIPIHVGLYMNNIAFTAKTYWNMGATLGSGGQLRYYTGSHLVFDVMALYSLALPMTAIQNNDALIETVYNAKGNKAEGSLTGFELKAGLTILF